MNNNPHRGLHNLYLFLGIIVACIVIWQFIAQFGISRFPFSTSSITTGGNTSSGGNDPTNGDGQEFKQQNTVQGAAIVEWWTGEVNGDNQAINCGTFKLPEGQSFTWTHYGHFWTYASNNAVNAN